MFDLIYFLNIESAVEETLFANHLQFAVHGRSIFFFFLCFYLFFEMKFRELCKFEWQMLSKMMTLTC